MLKYVGDVMICLKLLCSIKVNVKT